MEDKKVTVLKIPGKRKFINIANQFKGKSREKWIKRVGDGK